MDQINVQRWASSLRQFHRNYLQNTLVTPVASSPSTNNNTKHIFAPTSSEYSIIYNESFSPSLHAPPSVTDLCVGSQNGVRNASTTTKTRGNELPYDNHKYSFILGEKRNSISEDSNRISKSQFYTLNMTNKGEETPRIAQFSDNHTSDHHDIDRLSDTGTYIIDDDESEKKDPSSSSSFKRYINSTKDRHGTFDIHGLISSTAHTIHRPIVDSNIPKQDLSLSSSTNSSLLSFNDDQGTLENKSSLQQQSTPQNQIKPSECFVISPTFETNRSRRKIEAPWKSKLTTKSVLTKDQNLENSTTKPTSPPPSTHSNQNSTEKYSFHLQKQPPPPPFKTSVRPHTIINDQTSSFQRNSITRQTPSENFQHQRQKSFSSTMDNDETTPNLTKAYANKTFVLRQQQPTVTPSTSKTLSRQPLKSLSSVPSSITNSNNQTNRAVELRRARAQAKIEELAQRKKKQFHKPNHQIDIMSASWHSNASNTNKKDHANLQTTTKTKTAPHKQDLSATRTISSSLYHRSSSESSNPHRETGEQQYQKMSTSTYSIEEERCDSLRDNGQRLAIKLIQLSSGILEKLKPNDDVGLHELEELVDKLQTVNRTLTTIDASLTCPSDDNTFI